jgi:hypothetical protein
MLVKRLRFSLACFALGISISANAQTDLGASCGCPPVGSRPTVTIGGTATSRIDINGNLLKANTVLSCDTIYALGDKVFVGDGKSITIAPGTLIKTPSNAGDAHALIVSRGGKIFAPGTCDCPIVFTATADNMTGTYGVTNRAQWGGVVLLGKAANNLLSGYGLNTLADGIGFIEGFTSGEPRNEYGAVPGTEDNNDNSGIMTYVSIRHAGEIVGAANELNGLSLGSVGRGTTLQHIEIIANEDDGVEFFGGTVDLKYASAMFGGDDGFDWDQGWAGRGQFWVVVSTTVSDNGFELDGNDGNGDPITTAASRYLSNPKIYNCTFVGGTGVNGAGADNDQAIELKEASRGEIRNCIFSNFNRGVQFASKTYHLLDADGTGGAAPVAVDDCYNAWNAGTLKLENCTFVEATDPVRVAGAVGSPADLAKFAADGNTSVVSLAGFSGLHSMNVANNAITTQHDLLPGGDITTTTFPPVDGFYTPASYRGAFKVGEKSWLQECSFNALIGLQGNLLSCPTDLNFDGNTTTPDYLLFLSGYNVPCQ